jgi:hypothetical protein
MSVSMTDAQLIRFSRRHLTEIHRAGPRPAWMPVATAEPGSGGLWRHRQKIRNLV